MLKRNLPTKFQVSSCNLFFCIFSDFNTEYKPIQGQYVFKKNFKLQISCLMCIEEVYHSSIAEKTFFVLYQPRLTTFRKVEIYKHFLQWLWLRKPLCRIFFWCFNSKKRLFCHILPALSTETESSEKIFLSFSEGKQKGSSRQPAIHRQPQRTNVHRTSPPRTSPPRTSPPRTHPSHRTHTTRRTTKRPITRRPPPITTFSTRSWSSRTTRRTTRRTTAYPITTTPRTFHTTLPQEKSEL